MSGYDAPPTTFPGTGWYEPEISTSATAESLPLPTEKDELYAWNNRVARRKARGIGFAPPMKPCTRCHGRGKHPEGGNRPCPVCIGTGQMADQ